MLPSLSWQAPPYPPALPAGGRPPLPGEEVGAGLPCREQVREKRLVLPGVFPGVTATCLRRSISSVKGELLPYLVRHQSLEATPPAASEGGRGASKQGSLCTLTDL